MVSSDHEGLLMNVVIQPESIFVHDCEGKWKPLTNECSGVDERPLGRVLHFAGTGSGGGHGEER
jgi:hypothetical protein